MHGVCIGTIYQPITSDTILNIDNLIAYLQPCTCNQACFGKKKSSSGTHILNSIRIIPALQLQSAHLILNIRNLLLPFPLTLFLQCPCLLELSQNKARCIPRLAQLSVVKQVILFNDPRRRTLFAFRKNQSFLLEVRFVQSIGWVLSESVVDGDLVGPCHGLDQGSLVNRHFLVAGN